MKAILVLDLEAADEAVAQTGEFVFETWFRPTRTRHGRAG
jgi:hypothetical protein